MTKNHLLIMAVVALFLATGVNTLVAFSAASKVSNQESHLQVTARLAHELSLENRVKLSSEHKARLITVSQRCTLTGLIYRKVRKHRLTEPEEWKPYQKSYDKCVAQLNKLKGIKHGGGSTQKAHKQHGDKAFPANLRVLGGVDWANPLVG